MIRRVCQLGHAHPHLLFASQSQAWTTSELTRTLREHTDAALHQPLHVRLFRQLSNPITEKHVRPLMQPVDPDRDRTPTNVLDAVPHMAKWTPAVHANAYYGRDAAFPSWITPAFIDAYLWASAQRHHFLGFDRQIPSSTTDILLASSLSPGRKRILSENPNPPILANDGALSVLPRKRLLPSTEPVDGKTKLDPTNEAPLNRPLLRNNSINWKDILPLCSTFTASTTS
jgi:hypothetical protein